ncbi:2OG-Fe(II) oxygenase [Aquariibacter albus]|uniref:2OG-Fe(II) oxygenase n=1 Tax=Aquariibacter albus TaxID=2759899 RepID=A0A839HFL5_9BURK|nr:2OG-Fe(II) oxygenase [Aquariibacter albus]MBB1160817.1 2OG-Fe(II) oxygenase [Aquariibacter albus]
MKQPLTPAIRRWIAEQAAAGHSIATLQAAMEKTGWQPETAREALKAVLGAAVVAGLKQLAEAPVPAPAPADPAGRAGPGFSGTPGALPEPALEDEPPSLWAGDREVGVVVAMRQPRIVVFENLLDAAECEEIIARARDRLARSHTVDVATGDSEVNAARTSEGMFFGRGEHPVCARIEARLAALLRWPVERGEGLQVLRYAPGAQYKPHYDYFDPAQPGTPSILKRGGQRLATVVMYLNTPTRGGATTFPDVKLQVAPRRGHAVFFSYDRPHPATQTLHGGAPVLEGEKWVATKWLRAGRFD